MYGIRAHPGFKLQGVQARCPEVGLFLNGNRQLAAGAAAFPVPQAGWRLEIETDDLLRGSAIRKPRVKTHITVLVSVIALMVHGEQQAVDRHRVGNVKRPGQGVAGRPSGGRKGLLLIDQDRVSTGGDDDQRPKQGKGTTIRTDKIT